MKFVHVVAAVHGFKPSKLATRRLWSALASLLVMAVTSQRPSSLRWVLLTEYKRLLRSGTVLMGREQLPAKWTKSRDPRLRLRISSFSIFYIFRLQHYSSGPDIDPTYSLEFNLAFILHGTVKLRELKLLPFKDIRYTHAIKPEFVHPN
jgi:hypothetical protein